MKLKNLTNLTKNSANNQFSLNLRSKQLRKIGITPQNLLEIKIPKNLKLIKNRIEKEVKNGTKKTRDIAKNRRA